MCTIFGLEDASCLDALLQVGIETAEGEGLPPTMCFFSLKVTMVCPTEFVVCVASFTLSNLVHWVDPAQLQAKRKDMVTNSKSSTHQCQLVGLQIQPAAGDGIVGGNQKRPVAQRFG